MDDIINTIMLETGRIFKMPSLEEKKRQALLSSFSEYLEDIVTYDIRMGKSNALTFGSLNNRLTDNIRYALIASGISKKGLLPAYESYLPIKEELNADFHSYAKNKSTIITKKDFPFGSYEDAFIFFMLDDEENFSILSSPDLVALGIAQSERMSGYIEENDKVVKICENIAQALWRKKREKLEEEGCRNTLEYDICEEVFKRPQFRHYPIATAVALREMAKIDSLMKENLKCELSSDYLKYVLRNVRASRVVDSELMEKYEPRLVELLRYNFKLRRDKGRSR